MKLVEISDEYVDFLKSYFFKTMLDNKKQNRTFARKYVGIVLTINNYNYFAPLSSPKSSDFYPNGDIRPSSSIVLRMTKKGINKNILIGTIKLNNMIPVPLSEVSLIDINSINDIRYKNIINDEIKWISLNKKTIIKSAKIIYNAKINEEKRKNEDNKKFYDSIMPFKEAEKKCDEFMKNGN